MKGEIEEEQKHIINKDMKLCISSSLFRRIQKRATMIGHFLSFWLTKTKKLNNKKMMERMGIMAFHHADIVIWKDLIKFNPCILKGGAIAFLHKTKLLCMCTGDLYKNVHKWHMQ